MCVFSIVDYCGIIYFDMPFLSRLKAQAHSIAAHVKAFCSNFFRRVADGIRPSGMKEQGGRIRAWLLEKIPQEKRRIALIVAASAVAVVVLLIAGVSLLLRGRPDEQSGAPRPAASLRITIPADELFLPFEPDFVPGVMLGRERQAEWTAEDVEPFWQDPLRGGEQQWRDMIEKTIDDIMGSVP